jgi:hypothetical protein
MFSCFGEKLPATNVASKSNLKSLQERISTERKNDEMELEIISNVILDMIAGHVLRSQGGPVKVNWVIPHKASHMMSQIKHNIRNACGEYDVVFHETINENKSVILYMMLMK